MAYATASASHTAFAIQAPASNMRRAEIYDIIHGSEAAAADNPFLYLWQRTTTAGTNTAVTPLPLDPADTACVTVAGDAFSAEPTYTAGAVALRIPLNQRATFRWLAAPGGEIVIPATASNGLGCQTPTASALAISSTVHFRE
jgi:hypothetical protein